MKSLLFIIDMQNDFCSPTGKLYVPGAEKDIALLCKFIEDNNDKIDKIILTQDNHQVIDIAHPGFWKDKKGNQPQPFTNISANEVESGFWIPFKNKEIVLNYLIQLEKKGEFTHTIWPEHCIWGSEGAAIVPNLMNSIIKWAYQGKYFDIISKGTNPFTEHFGAFRANIPLSDDPGTQINTLLLKALSVYDKIWIAGEAKSHCVANSIKQLFDFPELMNKLVVLENCMSNIPGYELAGASIFEKAKTMGTQFMKIVY